MPTEVELKLGISPGDIPRLLRHPLIIRQGRGRPRTVLLQNVYYDTPDRALYRRRMALRLRRAGTGKRWIQTIKTQGRAVGGLHERPEWETDTTEGALQLARLPDASLRRFFANANLRAKLQPAFTTTFRRTLLQLAWANGDAVELAIDRGHIRAGDREEMLCEVELELKSGPPSRLFSVARMLHRAMPLRLSNTSKAEHGYRIASGALPGSPNAVHAKPVGRQGSLSSAAELCVAVLGSGLDHLQANEEGVRLSDAPGFVHQIRVAIRRLRSALKVFAPLLMPERLEYFQTELRWLADALNGARNWDVFVSQSLPAIRAAMPREPGLDWLGARAAAACEEQHQQARSAIDSAHYRGLVLELSAWLAAPRWQDAALARAPAAQFGAAVLSRRHRALKKHAGDIAGLSVPERHQVRIAAKKLRYAAEFFAPAFHNHRTEKYLDALAALQDILGTLNDEATTAQLMQQLSASTVDPAHQRTCARVLGWAAGLVRRQLREAGRAWRRFTERKAFWLQALTAGGTTGHAPGRPRNKSG